MRADCLGRGPEENENMFFSRYCRYSLTRQCKVANMGLGRWGTSSHGIWWAVQREWTVLRALGSQGPEKRSGASRDSGRRGGKGTRHLLGT